MSPTAVIILVLAGVIIVAGFVIYILAKSTAQANRDRDTIKHQADQYLKEIALQAGELSRRQKLIDEIQEANHEANERKDKIQSAGPDPRARFDTSMDVLRDIAKPNSPTDASHR